MEKDVPKKFRSSISKEPTFEVADDLGRRQIDRVHRMKDDMDPIIMTPAVKANDGPLWS